MRNVRDPQLWDILWQDQYVSVSNKTFYIWSSLVSLSSFIFVISFIMFMFNNRTLFLYLIAVELILLASILNFISSVYLLDSVEGEVLIYYTLTVAVSESAFGLGLLLKVFKNRGSLNPTYFNDLN